MATSCGVRFEDVEQCETPHGGCDQSNKMLKLHVGSEGRKEARGELHDEAVEAVLHLGEMLLDALAPVNQVSRPTSEREG